MWCKHFLRNILTDFGLSISALATVAWKKFNGKFNAKIDFPIGYFILPFTVADADIGNVKSFHTVFDKYLEHILVKFEQNRMVQSIQNFDIFDKNG